MEYFSIPNTDFVCMLERYSTLTRIFSISAIRSLISLMHFLRVPNYVQ